MPSTLSIVIPVLDDAAHLRRVLNELDAQQDVDTEVIVVDGGSTDDSRDVARDADARLFETDAGRGRQMNFGARRARFDDLLFLHADSRLDDPWLVVDALRQWHDTRAETDEPNTAAHFQVEFVDGDGEPIDALFYRFLEAKSALERPYTFNGDQGLLIGRDFFERLGGFDESLPYLEDQRLDRAIRRHGRWVSLDTTLRTSARRFETEGIWRRYALMSVMMGALAVDFDELFEALPELYVPHDEADRLPLGEILAGVREQFADVSLRRRWRLVVGVGRFVRRNAWQLALLADVVSDGNTPYLALFDGLVADRLDHPVVDVATGVVTSLLFLRLLPAVDETRLLAAAT